MNSNATFTLEQIHAAHAYVKSGSDFPRYIQDIKALGVLSFETAVVDSHTRYAGADHYQISSQPRYESLPIAGNSDRAAFEHSLKIHQAGETDYLTFCADCARTGIEKWIVDISRMTCVYYDKSGQEIVAEVIPEPG